MPKARDTNASAFRDIARLAKNMIFLNSRPFVGDAAHAGNAGILLPRIPEDQSSIFRCHKQLSRAISRQRQL